MSHFLILSYWFLISAEAARILVVLPSTFYSHQLPMKHIYKELSLRGHRVVAITTSPLGNENLTNLTEINVASVNRHVHDINFAKLFAGRSIYTNILSFLKGLGDVADEIFSNLSVQKLLNNKSEYFDLVIIEWCAHPVFAALSQRFKCPLIGFRSMELRPMCHEVIGNPTNPSYIPPGTKDAWSGFWGRLDNFLIYVSHYLLHRFVMLPKAETILQRHIKNYSFNVNTAESSVSLVITNTHPILNSARPVVPNYIQIFGLHLNRSKEEYLLPNDIAEYLDNATEGVIYMNFGSVVNMGDLTRNEVLILLKVLVSLPYKSLCKLEENDIIKSSKNVKIVKWVPQNTILAHKNVKLFITHGGLLSFQEAVYYKVPLVGLPFYGDQFLNVNRMVELQIGKRLDFYNIDEKITYSTIKEVIENPLYRTRITTISSMIKDQQKMPALEETIAWIEYVLRYKGTQYTSSTAINLNIFQYLLLDVVAFLLISVALTIYLTLKIFMISQSIVKVFSGKKEFKKE